MSDAHTPAIELTGLSKRFGGVEALSDVHLVVPQGSAFGFLGPNGAGKTTALRILAGLARPSSGAARIYGRDVVSAADETRALVGYVPDVPGFYPWMTAAEFLRFTGDVFGLRGKELERRVESLLSLSGLAGVDRKIGGFSRGMRQRLGIAQALVNAPRLLLLDEPTSALDPIGRKEVLDMVAALRGKTTVFFSTHILADVERVCDTVAILDRGRVVTHGPIRRLTGRRGGSRLLVDVDGGGETLERSVRGAPWLTGVDRGDDGLLRLSVNDLDQAQRAVPAAVAAAGLALRKLEVVEPTLEDVFVELVKGAKR